MSQDNNTGSGSTTTEQIENKPKRQHPLGPKIKCKIQALSITDRKGNIHGAINSYSWDIQQNTVVELPRDVVNFLTNATTITHGLDEKGFGKKETVPLYAVSIVK